MKTKLKLTIVVELDSPEYDNPETIMEEFVTETEYSFGGTDNVQVFDTEIRDSEIIDTDGFEIDLNDYTGKQYSVYVIAKHKKIREEEEFGFDTVKQMCENRIEFEDFDYGRHVANEYRKARPDKDVFFVDEFEGMIIEGH